MSIIHDALKKVQQELTPKTDSIWKTATPDDQLPIERLPSSPQKARSVLPLLCAIAFTLGALVFCYKQMRPYFYSAERSAKSSFYKLIHRTEQPEFKTRNVKDLIPLAKITVNPPQPLHPTLPNPTPATSTTIDSKGTQTLNIHGIMAYGKNNLALINDQVYQDGDEVDGVKIVKINLDHIIVDNNGKEERISVKN